MTGAELLYVLASDASVAEESMNTKADAYVAGFIAGAIFGSKYREDVEKIAARLGVMGKWDYVKGMQRMADELHVGPPRNAT